MDVAGAMKQAPGEQADFWLKVQDFGALCLSPRTSANVGVKSRTRRTTSIAQLDCMRVRSIEFEIKLHWNFVDKQAQVESQPSNCDNCFGLIFSAMWLV